jgi:hypothetical protein
MTLANMRELTGRLVPSMVSVSEKINRPDHEPSIFLKSPRIAFRIREALDLWQKRAERFVLGVLDAVKIDQVT